MRGEPFCGANLIFPVEAAGTVGSKFDIVRWIGIDEIIRFDWQVLKIITAEDPVFEDCLELRKVSKVSDRFMLTKWHVVFAGLIEAAESVEASSVEIVEKLRSLRALRFSFGDQFIETNAVTVETLRIIRHLDVYLQSSLQVTVEVYQVWIDVIQKSAYWR